MSKLELSEALELSHTSINAFTERLIQLGLVQYAGIGESSGGRRPVMIRLQENSRYSFGVCIAAESIHIVLADLVGHEKARRTIRPGATFDSTLRRIQRGIRDLITSETLDPSKLLGVGMTFPGVVDSERKLVEYAPNIGLRDYYFQDFERALGLQLYLENEAVAAARAEQFCNFAKAKQSFVYVSVAEGIGTGIVIDGKAYKSRNHKAGEFGHIRVSDQGLRCKCGRTDCWELYASKAALERYGIERYAGYLFRGIETILLALSPDEIIVGGTIANMAEIIDCGVMILRLNLDFYGYENIPIRATEFSENAAIRGSALLPLYDLYSHDTHANK